MSRGPVRTVRTLILPAAAAAWAAAVGVAVPALGDVIRLKDGNTYEGDIRPHPDGWVVVEPDGRRTVVPRGRVAGLEAKPKVAPAAADQRLASLRRAVEALPDPKQVLDRYRAFVVQYAGTPAGDTARADLKVWQDRVDRGLTKVGDKWVTDDERKALLARSYDTAERAMDLLRANRATDAAPVLEQALAENPQNPAAWYLKGLLLSKQDKAPDARKAFEQAAALAPDHAATHNNLAVVQWRQNQHVSALLSYEKALLAAPLHRTVLDNMAEALAALPENLRGGTNVARVVRHFNDQDLQLAQQMAAQGLRRWGSSWVPKAEFDKLQAHEREIRARVDQMEVEHHGLTRRVEQLAAEIKTTEQALKRMEQDSIGYDGNGRIVRYPLPGSYYEFLRGLGNMKAERQQRLDEQELMRREARRLVQSLPTPRYAGAQRLIDWEGTPIFGRPNPPAVAAGAAPATVPAAAGAWAARPGDPATPAPVTPTPTPAPVVQAPPARPPADPPPPSRPFVPPEKPSILDRRFADEPPPFPSPPPPAPSPAADDRPRP
jgi:tetratricopeptide (TPR) repeat protein